MFKTLIPILAIAATIGLYFVYIDPARIQIDTLLAEEAEFDEAIEKARELEAVKERLSTQMLSFEDEELAQLEKFFPTTIDSVHLIYDIDSIAQKYGMQLTNADTARERAAQAVSDDGVLEDIYGVVSLRFSVTSNYKNLLKFVNDLEQSLRLIDVSEIQFTTMDSDLSETDGGIIDMQFKTYLSN